MNTNEDLEKASKLHENVPPDWYFRSMKENLLQRYWHKRRFDEVGKVIEKVDGSVLDIGSADGTFTKVILNISGAKKTIGVDALQKSVNWANRHFKNNKRLKFELGDAHNLKFKNNSFDAVFALEVLEHVLRPVDVLKEIKRVLKKGGYAVFLVPSDNNLFKVIWFFWTKYYRGKIWSDCHIQSYRNGYLPRLAKKVGFKVEVDKKFLFKMLHLIKVRKIK
jgi:ubiquinone/menaquinone biosynthesis C-methylase UbiE